MVFASGFSEKLNIIATQHRPPYSAVLTFEQASYLCNLAGYTIYMSDDGYHIRFNQHDNSVGADCGIYVIWEVQPRNSALIYHPALVAKYERGDSQKVNIILNDLSDYLPNLGYSPIKVIELSEKIIELPPELKKSSNGIEFMLESEFLLKYSNLFLFLKQIFE